MMMAKDPKTLGLLGERLAAAYLKKQGFQILAQNLRTDFGEIDILAKKKGLLVIIEVKTVANGGIKPFEQMTAKKLAKLASLANYCFLHFAPKEIRIDFIGLDFSSDPPRLEHITNLTSF